MILFESEKEFEDMLCDRLDEGSWIVEDECVDGYERQVKLESYGVVDLLLHDTEMDLVDGCEIIIGRRVKIVELKITELKSDSLAQIARYKAFFDAVEHDFELSYVLVCKASCSYRGDLVFLAQSMDWLDIYTYKFSLTNGVEFERLDCFSPTESRHETKEEAIRRLDLMFSGGQEGML